MHITSNGIIDGHFADRYGKRGAQFNEHGMPTFSIPFSIHDAPESAATFAIVLEDKDAYPVSGGFVWIHWIAANIERTDIGENESVLARDFVQGAKLDQHARRPAKHRAFQLLRRHVPT